MTTLSSWNRCDWCGQPSKQKPGCINRARHAGLPLFCDRVCAGLRRRNPNPLTDEQKKAAKREYDQAYRAKNLARIKARKKAYNDTHYDPVEAAIKRKNRMPQHVEYCRRPEYRAKKHEYDRRYQMERSYGPWWEAGRVMTDLMNEIKSRATDYEIRMANGTTSKSTKRKREHAQITNDQSRTDANGRKATNTYGHRAEGRAMGNVEGDQIRHDAARTG